MDEGFNRRFNFTMMFVRLVEAVYMDGKQIIIIDYSLDFYGRFEKKYQYIIFLSVARHFGRFFFTNVFSNKSDCVPNGDSVGRRMQPSVQPCKDVSLPWRS